MQQWLHYIDKINGYEHTKALVMVESPSPRFTLSQVGLTAFYMAHRVWEFGQQRRVRCGIHLTCYYNACMPSAVFARSFGSASQACTQSAPQPRPRRQTTRWPPATTAAATLRRGAATPCRKVADLGPKAAAAAAAALLLLPLLRPRTGWPLPLRRVSVST